MYQVWRILVSKLQSTAIYMDGWMSCNFIQCSFRICISVCLKHLVWCLMFQSERNINVLVSDTITDCEDFEDVWTQGAAAVTERPRVIVKRQHEWGNIKPSVRRQHKIICDKATWENIKSSLSSRWEKVKEANQLMTRPRIWPPLLTQKGNLGRAHVLGNHFEKRKMWKACQLGCTYSVHLACMWHEIRHFIGWVISGNWIWAQLKVWIWKVNREQVIPRENVIKGVIECELLIKEVHLAENFSELSPEEDGEKNRAICKTPTQPCLLDSDGEKIKQWIKEWKSFALTQNAKHWDLVC